MLHLGGDTLAGLQSSQFRIPMSVLGVIQPSLNSWTLCRCLFPLPRLHIARRNHVGMMQQGSSSTCSQSGTAWKRWLHACASRDTMLHTFLLQLGLSIASWIGTCGYMIMRGLGEVTSNEKQLSPGTQRYKGYNDQNVGLGEADMN